ncbi:MAG: AN1-type zinc finger domain-containing protein [Candidatus Heimdallarchaeum endolithica]|uniref:AN1-type zinc finger domain-containing protein n=1 Tax=Candidatus Heimdallarchaeum endolithica TaxID=2876572 RepID=A0A9Y1BRI6_9ARCH|nr:MAG: AN1-type zinc finger domain-containing protein [Candidatus Heimdallarchaeum endolithica]
MTKITKTRCSYPNCNNEEEMLPFKCKLCGNYYCSKHRLPEQHNCVKLNYFQSDEYKKSKISRASTPVKTITEEKKEKIFPIDTSSKRVKRTSSYFEKKDRFLARSAFFTLYAFEKNFFNVLIPTIFISLILSLYFTVNLRFYRNTILIILPIIFIGIGVTYSLHELIHYVVGKRVGVSVKNAMWLQAFLISLLSIVFPVLILPPSILILKKRLFRRTQGNIIHLNDINPVRREYGITALAGVTWLLGWEIIAAIFTLLRVFYPASSFIIALYSFSSALVVFIFGFLVFHSMPLFPLSDGNYIFEWKKNLAWALWISNIVIYFVYIILNNVLYI